MPSQTPRASYGKTGVLHLVATAEEPITSSEVAELIDSETQNVSEMLTALYREGFVWRRDANEGWGGTEYEYILAPREQPQG